jgi:hypothetical protein
VTVAQYDFIRACISRTLYCANSAMSAVEDVDSVTALRELLGIKRELTLMVMELERIVVV